MSMSPYARRVLLDAADLIDERGWCQNTFEDDHGRICARRAISMACDHFNDGSAISLAVYPYGVCDFNDAPGRTQAEVVAKLREVAAS